MIARIFIWLLLVIVLPDIYIYLHYFSRRYKLPLWGKLLWWAPCAVMCVYTCVLAFLRSFAPADLTWLNTYLFLLGMFVWPKLCFTICSFIGWLLRKYVVHSKRNWGHYIGVVVGLAAFVMYVYGLTVGISEIKVRHVDLYFDNLPKAFDGLKIVHTSDMHVGTFEGWRRCVLEREIDSIRAQVGEKTIFCFTGDIQNMYPEEVERMMPLLRRLPKTYFILGNHDYAEYAKPEPGVENSIRRKLLSLEGKLGKTLCNEHVALTADDGSRIWLVGTENDSNKKKIVHSDYARAMKGIPANEFVIMLQHDPSFWEKDVLPKSHADLTLSGHTHGGQMQFWDWRPTKALGNDCGLFEKDSHYLYVSAGLGGLVPFRFNQPNEIAVITLHRKNK